MLLFLNSSLNFIIYFLFALLIWTHILSIYHNNKYKSSIKITNKFAVLEHKVRSYSIIIEYVDLIDNFVRYYQLLWIFFYQLFLSIELTWL